MNTCILKRLLSTLLHNVMPFAELMKYIVFLSQFFELKIDSVLSDTLSSLFVSLNFKNVLKERMWKRVYSLVTISTKCYGFIQFNSSILDCFITVIKVSLKPKVIS